MSKRIDALAFGPFIPAPESFFGPGVTTFEAAQKVYHDRLIKKWEWLLEGRPSPDGARPVWDALPDRSFVPMAQLFENQVVLASGHTAFEDTSLSTVDLPVRYSLPIIRQAYASVVVAEIAAMQPLSPYSGGTGNVFYIKFYRDPSGVNVKVLDSTYAVAGEGVVPAKLQVTITKETVTAEKRILNAVYSTEVFEDARGALGIDIGSELVQQMSESIAREIDYHALSLMLAQATAGNTNWDHNVPSGITEKEHYETLDHAVIDTGENIHANVFRREEWVVGGRTFVSYIRKANAFRIESMGNGPRRFMSGVERIGRVNDRWDLFESPMVPDDQAIVSYYPRSNIDTPFVLCPYVPLDVMPLVYAGVNPSTGAYENTDMYSRNVRTRSTEKTTTPEAIGTVTIV